MTDTHPLFAGIGGHHSHRSGTNEWLTPPAIHTALGGADSFDLDPASPEVRPWPTARQHYTARDNGLILPWFGRVFLNPPYSTALIAPFMRRMAAHGRGVALIFARTETETFVETVWREASAVLFLFGRLNFHHADGTRAKANSGAPSVLVSYGMDDADCLADCGIAGQFVPLSIPRGVVVAVVPTTWAEVVAAVVRDRRGPVRLDDLYRAVAGHWKARGNRNVEAKIRQELQRGPFRRVGRGTWEAVDACSS